jgi:hypothetical protein
MESAHRATVIWIRHKIECVYPEAGSVNNMRYLYLMLSCVVMVMFYNRPLRLTSPRNTKHTCKV